ncbi:type III secretion system inner membrane ring subunit SctD [uncultured Thiocystis sp.]|jgi:type III secretion system YscD/HrpQ family protein|uniref:type III secretion system inner membrane ring subunit SctD n=1 Tax=uncultured Thiocystis sp. TaxID=1202134 RepID=UPI0025CE5869|nr:type III secretion system inner membrane ring subunit SctD [uncultured Thiocystis sp.]
MTILMDELESACVCSGWVLRVLTGIQQGAGMSLLDGRSYTVGHDDGCDIVLWDERVAPRHFLVRVQGERIHLQSLDSPIELKERRLDPGDSIEIASARRLRVSGLEIALGSPETNWLELCVTEPALHALPTAEVGVTGGQDSAIVQADGAGTSDEGAPSPSHAGAAGRDGGRRRLVIVALLGLLILVFASWSLFISGRGSDHTLVTADPPDRRAERAHTLAASMGLAGIEIRLRTDGVLVLSGYCETQAMRDRVTAALIADGQRVDNRLWPEERIRELLALTLEQLGAGLLGYEYLGNGEVRLHGWLRSGLTSDQVVNTVHADVPGVRHVSNAFQSVDLFLDDLREQLRTAHLERKLVITSDLFPAVIAGRLDTQEMARWEVIRDGLATHYPDLRALESNILLVERSAVSASRPASVAVKTARDPPILILGTLIGANRISYAVLGDGERLTKGQLIDGRYMVEEIQFDRVIAFDGAERKTFHVGVKANDRGTGQ